LKTQMKKNQNEMKKLLNQKESSIQAQSAVLTDRAEPGQLLTAASSSSLNTVSRESVEPRKAHNTAQRRTYLRQERTITDCTVSFDETER